LIFINQSIVFKFSGTLNETYNYQSEANACNPFGYDQLTKTYFIVQTDVYVHFLSDRLNVSTGFQIQYEPGIILNLKFKFKRINWYLYML